MKPPIYIIPDIDTVTDADIEQLKQVFAPVGSGPIRQCQIIIGLLNQIQQLKHRRAATDEI
jgi:hypothetical protein